MNNMITLINYFSRFTNIKEKLQKRQNILKLQYKIEQLEDNIAHRGNELGEVETVEKLQKELNKLLNK